MNQEMPTFDVTSIPSEFNPLVSNTLDNTVNQNLYAGDDKLFVQFRTDPVLNPSKSTKEGRPIYDDVDMIIIRTPGSQLTSVVAPVEHYMDRFGAKYRAWKANQTQAAISGTPLEAFPFLFNKPSLTAELKALNIFTVEQLAELPDAHKQKIMGAHELCRKAATWIDSSKAAAEDAEKRELLDRIAALEAQVGETEAAPKQKRGKKVETPVESTLPSFLAEQSE